MVALRDIARFSERLVQEFKPEKVVLFGSHARGTATEDSDVDLLVVMQHERRPVDKAVEIRLKARPPFPVDIVVRSPATVRDRLRMGDSFLREILDEGRVLYESADV